MKMQCRCFEAANSRVIELAGNMARNVIDPKPHDFVSDSSPDSGDTLGDHGIYGSGRLAFSFHRLEIEDLAAARQGHSLHSPGIQVDEEPALPASTMLLFFDQLSPDVGTDIVQRTGVPGALRHRVLHVIVTHGNVGPLLWPDLIEIDESAPVVGSTVLRGKDAGDLAM